MKKMTVAITVRGDDKRLLATIESVRERTKDLDCEIMVVSDGPVSCDVPNDVILELTGTKPRGTSFAKHTAMLRAEHEVVVLCDSHMIFPAGCFELYYDHLTAFPKHVVCSIVNMCDVHGGEGLHYAGCFETKIVGSPRKPTNRDAGSRQPFGVGWKKTTFSGPIQGVMGGCYGLTKSFYDTMEQPWQYGKGWGGDEESISLATWYMGGLCWLLPQIVNHYSGSRGFVEDNYFKSAPLYNRLRVVEMIDDTATREEFVRWFYEAHHFEYKEFKDFSPVTAWRESIEKISKRNFVDLIEDWESKITVRELYYVQEERGMNVKKNVKKTQMMEMWRRSEKKQEVGKREYETPEVHVRANYGAFENRRICHKCGSTASKVNDTRKTGRTIIRYRECLACGARRPTQEILPL